MSKRKFTEAELNGKSYDELLDLYVNELHFCIPEFGFTNEDSIKKCLLTGEEFEYPAPDIPGVGPNDVNY